jgi:signal transduction histidine kinase
MNEINTRLISYLDNHSSLLKITVGTDGIITHANHFAERLAGRSLQSTHIQDFFTGFNANLDIEKLLTEEIENTLYNVNTYRGLPETYYFTTFKIPEGMILIGEMNSMEIEEMRKSMVSFNNELNNLTRELHKKNIQLDQLNKLKDQFLGMAAHDLRNPISSIIMFSELVLESEDYEISEELRQILEVIKNSSEFMLRLLEELLDVVKIESGKLQLNFEKVNLHDLLKKNIELNTLLAAKKDIKLSLNVPQQLPRLSIDPVKIEQVLNNLISNAIKYSFNNTTVTVSAFSSAQQVVVSVQDQGQGIPKNEMDKLFVPFAKLSIQGTAGEKSTGLGLSIVKRIIAGHFGRIWVESEEGRGSNFSFSLPLNI